jgi:ribosomal protein L29
LKQENNKLQLSVKELKEELSNLRKQLIQVNKQMEINNKEKIFDKEDYQYLSQLKRELKADSVREIYEKIEEYKAKINQKAKERGIDF